MANRGAIRAATDVGGTFTDLVCLYADPATGNQRLVTGKSDTTPPHFERGVIDVLDKIHISPAEIGLLTHGTTVVINALTERKGACTALITTQGFRDSLEIARGNRPDFLTSRTRSLPRSSHVTGAARCPDASTTTAPSASPLTSTCCLGSWTTSGLTGSRR